MNTNAPENDNLTLTASDIYQLLLRKLWVMVICFLTVMMAAVGYLSVATPLYESTSTLQVETKEERLYNANDGQEQDLRGQEVMETISETLQMSSLYERVVARPEIGDDPRFPPVPLAAGTTMNLQQKAKFLSNYIQVKLRKGTRLIDVTVFHQVPAMAQTISAALVEEYLQQTAMEQVGTSKETGTFLLQQLDGIKANLQKAEDSLQLYQNAILIRDRIRDEQKIIDDLKQRYRDKHPKMIQANALLDDLLKEFDLSINSIRQKSAAEKEYWSQGDADSASLTGNDRIMNELKMVEARQNVLTRDETTQSALFESITKQMRDASVNEEAAPTQVTLVQPAELPLYPTKPKRTIILVLAAMGGLVFGFITVIGLYYMDSSFYTVDEAERVLGLPVLSVIPDVGTRAKVRRRLRTEKKDAKNSDDSDPDSSGIEVIADPGSTASEGVRSLRASLALTGREDLRKSLLFTSAVASEGKTFVTSNYAVALAQQGLRTLLIDADLRRPTVHERFQLSNRGPGLVEHVLNDLELSQVVHSQYIPNLDVMLSGGRCPNPAEFLASSGFADAIKMALLKYDRVVLDSAPVNVVSDTLLIVPQVQAVCLVLHAGKTPRRAVKRAIYNLKMAQARPLGVVLNKMPRRIGGINGSYYYYYQTGDKYGEVYGAKR